MKARRVRYWVAPIVAAPIVAAALALTALVEAARRFDTWEEQHANKTGDQQ